MPIAVRPVFPQEPEQQACPVKFFCALIGERKIVQRRQFVGEGTQEHTSNTSCRYQILHCEGSIQSAAKISGVSGGQRRHPLGKRAYCPPVSQPVSQISKQP